MITTTGPDRGSEGRYEALLVFLLVLLGGATLLAVVDRFHHLGPTAGNTCFVVLTIVAALAARSRRHHDGCEGLVG